MGSGTTSVLIYFVVLAVAFYFLIIRPQQQRQKQARELQSKLRPGDRVLTASGIFGTLRSIDQDKARVSIAEGVEIEILTAAVTQLVEQAPGGPDRIDVIED